MKRQKGKHAAPKKRAVLGRVASMLILAIGITVITFPSAAKWATAIELAKDGQDYTLTANAQSAQRFDRAVAANETGDYKAALNAVTVEGTSVIARLQIPSIGVDLPVYPDSKDETLKKGAGHLEGSSLPVGGAGTRSVITAHSGMPTKRMFDRLPKTEVGDQVYLTVLGQTLTYEVTGQRVDTPEDGSKHIQPQADKDLLTLVTCTPYGVNTHRLLVTAERVEGALAPEVTEAYIAGFPWWAVAYTAALTVELLTVHLASLRSGPSNRATRCHQDQGVEGVRQKRAETCLRGPKPRPETCATFLPAGGGTVSSLR